MSTGSTCACMVTCTPLECLPRLPGKRQPHRRSHIAFIWLGVAYTLPGRERGKGRLNVTSPISHKTSASGAWRGGEEGDCERGRYPRAAHSKHGIDACPLKEKSLQGCGAMLCFCPSAVLFHAVASALLSTEPNIGPHWLGTGCIKRRRPGIQRRADKQGCAYK